jgi:hypothetical protein
MPKVTSTDGLAILSIMLTKSLEFSQVMLKAQAEGRDISAEEIDTFRESLMDSDAALEAAIAKAKGEGR